MGDTVKTKRFRRRHGEFGWHKGECPYSKTGWAWWKDNDLGENKDGKDCTCIPCTRLMEAE